MQAAEDATEGWWWWPHREFVIVSERPTALHRNAAGQLHAEHGMAIQFADGWGLHRWNGMPIEDPSWLDRKFDPSLALTHPNAEQGRIAAEILGWEKVLAHVETKRVDMHRRVVRKGNKRYKKDDLMVGELLEATIHGERTRFLRMLCGTGRIFARVVPSTINTAMEAQEWMWDLPPGGYKPAMRT
jgi:hypothetical protein